MSGKKNRKRSKKNKIHPERFAYDILSFILSLCAFPKEKMNYEERENNSYKDAKFVSKFGGMVMAFSLYYRDEWKTMFESRLKTSGFDTIEKIENYLTSLLAINSKFKVAPPAVKVRMSLAVYSEMLLFLNYRGIDFDFGQIVNSWSRLFTEQIALCRSASDGILGNLYKLVRNKLELAEGIARFMQNVASPYGSRDGVSTIYCKEVKTAKKMLDEKLQVVRSMVRHAINAKKQELSLPADFETSAVLPGDRESPEPTLNIEIGAVGGKELSEDESTRSSGVAECRSGKFPTVLPSGSETSIFFPREREPPKSQMRVDGGGVRSRKESRVRNRRINVAEYRSGENPTSLPGDCQTFSSVLNPARDGVRRKIISERERTRSTGVAECRSGEYPTVLPSGSETSICLPGDHEQTKQQLTLDEGGVRSRKESSARNRQTSVTEYGFGEMLSFLSGDCKSYEPQLSLECDDVGGKEASKREWTQATGVEICRSGERESSQTPYEMELEEKFALMDLNRLPDDYDVISNKRKSRN